jgi:hypothetical protein
MEIRGINKAMEIMVEMIQPAWLQELQALVKTNGVEQRQALLNRWMQCWLEEVEVRQTFPTEFFDLKPDLLEGCYCVCRAVIGRELVSLMAEIAEEELPENPTVQRPMRTIAGHAWAIRRVPKQAQGDHGLFEEV